MSNFWVGGQNSCVFVCYLLYSYSSKQENVSMYSPPTVGTIG